MLTGELRNQIDGIWNDFWSGGLANPLQVIEQITYLIFIKRLDEMQELEERKATTLGKPIERRIFPDGKDERGEPYTNLRWSRFKNFAGPEMFRILDEHVFPFIRALNGEGTSYARHMRDARFQIPGPARDTKGDVYEYMLSKIASAGQNGQFRTPRHIIATMVELVEPKPEDVICDPAVGTCGFLVAAGEYPKIIASRESSTMVSTWTEYLRLSVIGEGSASLEICQYEVLAEADYGEDDEDQPLPEQLEGKKVVGISQDGYVVGGDLVCGDDQFSFTRADIEEALQWLSDENWKVTKEMTDELRSSVNT